MPKDPEYHSKHYKRIWIRKLTWQGLKMLSQIFDMPMTQVVDKLVDRAFMDLQLQQLQEQLNHQEEESEQEEIEESEQKRTILPPPP